MDVSAIYLRSVLLITQGIMHEVIKLFSDKGHCVVVDDVILDLPDKNDWLFEYSVLFSGYQVMFVILLNAITTHCLAVFLPQGFVNSSSCAFAHTSSSFPCLTTKILASSVRVYGVKEYNVVCPMEELIRRQTERGDRFPDQAQWQTDHSYADIPYDLTVDTFKNTTEKCAEQILEFLNCPSSWKAFEKIKTRFVKERAL